MSDPVQLQYLGHLEFTEMASAFPVQVQPPHSHTDYLTNFTPGAVQTINNIRADVLLNCGFPSPLFVPHNQVYSGSPTAVIDNGTYVRTGIPSVTYQSLTVTGPGVVQAFAKRPHSYQYFDCLCTDETQAQTMVFDAITAPLTNVQGFECAYSRNIFHFIDPANSAAPKFRIRWAVQTDGTPILFSVSGTSLSNAKLYRSYTDASHFTEIKGALKSGSSAAAHKGNARPEADAELIFLVVLCMNGKMLVSLNGDTAPFVVNLDTNWNGRGPFPQAFAYPTVTQAEFYASYFSQFAPHFHPIKFNTDACVTPNIQDIGFKPDESTPFYWYVTGLQKRYTVNKDNNYQWNENGGQGTLAQVYPGGMAGTNPCDPSTGGDTNTGESVQYQLRMQNPVAGTYCGTDFADMTMAAVRVATKVKSLSKVYPYKATRLVPQEIRETISFDPNQMNIRHSLDVTLDNWYGIEALNQRTGLQGVGNIGVSMRMGWAHQGPSPVDGLPGFQHFYGYGHSYEYVRPNSSQAMLRISCSDQMEWLEECKVAYPPDFDQWNHYYAMAWLAAKAGITADQLAFIDFVPDDPGESTQADTEPYFLPAGEGNHTWTPRDRMSSILELMEFIRRATGFLLYFDAYGYLRYEPLIPPTLTPIKKVFRETSDFGYGLAGGAVNEMHSLSARNSTRNTRNQVVIVGIDSYSSDWSPIVVKREDTNSIFNKPGSPPPNNLKGFASPLIWIDNRFANKFAAESAADQIFQIVRLPDLEVNFTAWLQPELFPMDIIYVDDPKSNSYGVPFFVMSVTNTLSCLGENLTLSSSVMGKLLL